MGLPRLLLVDDSEAILALEMAALRGHGELATAPDGRAALATARQFRPDAMVLDLSMPHLRGEQVLKALAADAALRHIPVVVCSTETEKKAECLRAGARAFLRKPFDPGTLRETVLRVVEEARREARQEGLTALFVRVGDLELGIPITCVRSVLHQVATRPLPLGPAHLSEFVELYGEPALVLDLARRLGVPHRRPLAERMLVLVHVEGQTLALCVDEVTDPEDVAASSLVRRDDLGGAAHGPVALLGMAQTARGPVPLLDPAALASPRLLRDLRQTLAGAA